MSEATIKKNAVIKSASLLMAGTILSKALGFLRELIVAYKYGSGVISDSFILTNGVSDILFCAIAIAISVNFIPCYTRIEGADNRDRFTSNLLDISVLVLLIGSIATFLFPKIVLVLFANGLNDAAKRVSITMLRIVIFSSIPIILTSLFQAYCQANGEFLTTAICGSVINSVIIVFILLSNSNSYYLLSVGTLVGNFFGMLIPLYGTRKKGFHYHPILSFRDDSIRSLILLTGPLLIENVASNLSLLVDRNLASYLDSGTITGLSYAGNIANIASTMIATAIMTATFPMFSKLIASGDQDQFSSQFRKYASVISFLLGPISVFMILNANDIITVIFEHGAFNSAATKIVSECMICYAIGVLPMGLQSYLIRGFYAMQDTKNPVKIKVFALMCNIILNLITVRFIQHIGIALSTSVSYIIAYFLLTRSLKKKHGVDSIREITKEGGLSLLLSIIPGVLINLLFNHLFSIKFLVLKLLAEGVLFVLSYGIMMTIFRRDTMSGILKVLKRS